MVGWRLSIATAVVFWMHALWLHRSCLYVSEEAIRSMWVGMNTPWVLILFAGEGRNGSNFGFEFLLKISTPNVYEVNGSDVSYTDNIVVFKEVGIDSVVEFDGVEFHPCQAVVFVVLMYIKDIAVDALE
eukprot:5532901-Ditylum_brightwellii.AAC.1